MTRKPPEAAVREFTQAVGLLVRRARAAASAQGLSLTETAVMSRLAKEGPATIADLARSESMKPQSMGTTVAALEENGMIERKPHPTDGRQMLIELTVKGAGIWKSGRDAKRTWLVEAIAELGEEDRNTLFKAGAIMKRLVGQ